MSIQGLGYTNDGMVWMNIQVEHDGKPGLVVMTMEPENAKALADEIIQAAEAAKEKRTIQ